MMNNSSGWMGSGMHGGMWLWPVVGVLVVAVIVFIVIRLTKK